VESAFYPPIKQQLRQLWRQHGVAVYASFALLDPQQHALGVDVADLKRHHLGDAKPGAVGGSGCRLVPGAAGSRSAMSSTLSTVGSRRAWRTTVSRRARSGQSSAMVRKKRSAETALLILGGCMLMRVWCSWKRRRSSAVAVSGDRPIKPQMPERVEYSGCASPR
jgi:hypothetical protein